MVDAMNNISLPPNMTIERCYDDFNCQSKPCQDINLCNESTGIFENPAMQNMHEVKCATVYAGSVQFTQNTIQKQILYLNLPLRVIWLGTRKS